MTTSSTKKWVLCSSWLLLAAGCSSDTTNTDDAAGTVGADGGETDPACPVVVADADCNRNLRPIVFVHGNFGSGDNIANVALLFASNGYCMERFYAIDYDSGATPDAEPGLDGRLDAFIDEVLADTGADKVDLMGHSNGTINDRNYLLEGGTGNVIPEHAAKVAHYIHLAGGPLTVPADPPTLCVASNSDATATGLCPDQAAESVVFELHDHFGVASSDESFAGIYKFLRGEDPKYTSIQCGAKTITLEAKMESFADNIVPTGATVEVYELGSEPRERGAPIKTLTVGADGTVGPWEAKRLGRYEFKVVDAQGNVVGRQYITSLKRDNRLIRFLTPSQALAIVTDSIVRSEGHSAVIARTYNGAFRKDFGDSLKVNGAEVLIDEISTAKSVTVGLFMFDQNQNGVSDSGSLASYSGLPFLRGTDVFMDASTPGLIQIEFNGSVTEIPNWPSQSEGPIFVYFP